MKTEQEIDGIMATIPAEWRYRWCGGERGPCACIGCVQVGNRLEMARAFTGHPFRGDPEYIFESKIPRDIYERLKITHEEWENWRSRHPDAGKSVKP